LEQANPVSPGRMPLRGAARLPSWPAAATSGSDEQVGVERLGQESITAKFETLTVVRGQSVCHQGHDRRREPGLSQGRPTPAGATHGRIEVGRPLGVQCASLSPNGAVVDPGCRDSTPPSPRSSSTMLRSSSPEPARATNSKKRTSGDRYLCQSARAQPRSGIGPMVAPEGPSRIAYASSRHKEFLSVIVTGGRDAWSTVDFGYHRWAQPVGTGGL
jgi:hypothetical protein